MRLIDFFTFSSKRLLAVFDRLRKDLLVKIVVAAT